MAETRAPLKVANQKKRRIVFDRQGGIYTALGYRSARTATAEGRSYHSYPSTEHELRDRKALIAQSRDFFRNNPIYKGMVNSAVSYIVGSGFKLNVNTGSKNVDKKIENLWRQWFKKPDITKKFTGLKIAQMVCREMIIAGDITVAKLKQGLIQLFEAEQIASKRWNHPGITVNAYGAPTVFKLCGWKSTGVDTAKAKAVAASKVFYIANLERPSQLRGVPAAQAAFAMLHRIHDVCDSEAFAWQILSRLALSIQRENAAEDAYTESVSDDTKTGDENFSDRVTEVDYGIIFHADPGEKIEGIERNIPGQNFPDAMRMFLRMLGLPMGIPLEIVLLDWTQSNYSQSRAVIEQTYQRFLDWQELIDSLFYSALFEWKLNQWRNEGKVGGRNKVEYEFIRPAYPWLDMLKEVKAWATKVERGFVTHTQVCKSLNTDRAEVIERRTIEVMDAIERANKINKKYPDAKVPWEIFCGLKPGGSKSDLADEADTENANENKE